MGHQYIERLPRTKPWKAVVTAVRDGGDAEAVAEAVVVAAQKIILPFARDPGVVAAVWYLIRLPIAARENHFPTALRNLGLEIHDAPGLMDLVAAASDALDAEILPDRRTDLGEMAQTALVETLAGEFGPSLENLFGEDPTALHGAVYAKATARNFGDLAVAYFSRLVGKTLTFFASRALADHVGEGRRFRTLAVQAAFVEALETYSREVAAGVDEYAGGWFRKAWHDLDRPIDRTEAGAFLSHASDKLNWALARR